MCPDFFSRIFFRPHNPFLENIIDKRRLSRTTDTCHTGHDLQRKPHIDILQVVLHGSGNLDAS